MRGFRTYLAATLAILTSLGTVAAQLAEYHTLRDLLLGVTTGALGAALVAFRAALSNLRRELLTRPR